MSERPGRSHGAGQCKLDLIASPAPVAANRLEKSLLSIPEMRAAGDFAEQAIRDRAPSSRPTRGENR